MKIHELNTTKKKSIKRSGRGISAGRGKTAGRGTKGQNSRAGSKFKPGFEGGQTKLAQRLPKARGFTSRNQLVYQIIGLSDLEEIGVKQVNPEVLKKAGLINSSVKPVKLLANGTITKSVTVSVHKSSEAATKAISKVGGQVNIIDSKTKSDDSKNKKVKESK